MSKLFMERHYAIFPADKYPQYDFQHHVGSGWAEIIHYACLAIDAVCSASGTAIVTTQIKEKFGTLRWYYAFDFDPERDDPDKDYNNVDKLVHAIISAAEDATHEICEVCGLPGEVRAPSSHGWLLCHCDKCYKERVEITGKNKPCH